MEPLSFRKIPGHPKEEGCSITWVALRTRLAAFDSQKCRVCSRYFFSLRMRRLDARSVFSDGARRAASDGTINFDFGTKNGKFIFCHFLGSRQTLNAVGSRLKAGDSRLEARGSR